LTSTLNDLEVTNILNTAKNLIDDGSLNLVLIQSLTKFSHLGLDKVSGGLISVFNNNGEHWQYFNQTICKISATEEVDISTENFFAYFASLHHDLVKEYIALVNRNVQFVYQETQQQLNRLETANNGRFQITTSSDPKACYVAINMHGLIPAVEVPTIKYTYTDGKPPCGYSINEFPTFSVTEDDISKFANDLLEELIYPLCRFHKLPITGRFSIGFPLTSVNSVYDSLRFTIGLESKHQLESYSDILAYTSFVLNRISNFSFLFLFELKKNDKKEKYKIYQLRTNYFKEKVSQYMTMTPDFQMRREAIGTHADGPYTEYPLTIYMCGGKLWGEQKGNIICEAKIKVHTRQFGEIPLIDSRLTLQEKRLIASCFTAVAQQASIVHIQLGNVTTHSGADEIALPNFEQLNLWKFNLLYGPFYTKGGTELFFALHQFKVTLIFNAKKYDEESILVKHGDIITPLINMSIKDKDFLFRENAYEEDDSCRDKGFDMQYKPRNKNSMQLNIDDEGFLVMETDYICCTVPGITVYYRPLNEKYSIYEIDYWTEKDPIFSRLLRLITVCYVQNQKSSILFKPYDMEFTRFIMNLPQEEGKSLFQKAVVVIIAKKQNLKKLFADFQKNIVSSDGEIKEKQYHFSSEALWLGYNHKLESICNALIDNALGILLPESERLTFKESTELTEGKTWTGILDEAKTKSTGRGM
jgi:hypothetical protein